MEHKWPKYLISLLFVAGTYVIAFYSYYLYTHFIEWTPDRVNLIKTGFYIGLLWVIIIGAISKMNSIEFIYAGFLGVSTCWISIIVLPDIHSFYLYMLNILMVSVGVSLLVLHFRSLQK